MRGHGHRAFFLILQRPCHGRQREPRLQWMQRQLPRGTVSSMMTNRFDEIEIQLTCEQPRGEGADPHPTGSTVKNPHITLTSPQINY